MPDVRARCLGTITKLLAAGSVEQLEKVLAELPISSFVASLLSSRDLKAQAAAIQMAETLMAKLPHIFGAYFVKEGVAHALEQLASSPAGAAAAAAAGFGAAKAAAGERGGAAAAAAAPAAAAGGAGDGPRRSSSGAAGAAGLPPPSPPVTRSRRTSKADSVRAARGLRVQRDRHSMR
jgi:E3 ubiquitin-protein ligase TRIP12